MELPQERVLQNLVTYCFNNESQDISEDELV